MLITCFPRGALARVGLTASLAFAAENLVGEPSAIADDASALRALFAPLSDGDCIPMADVRAVGAVVQLTPDQFQFVRAFWMAIPPVNHALPPGDKAFYAKDQSGVGVFGLYDDDGHVCSVFEATDWLQSLVDAVGRGETGKVGDKS